MKSGKNSAPRLALREVLRLFAPNHQPASSAARWASEAGSAIPFPQLLEEAGVACLSGTSFGEFGEGYLRFSIANSMENLGKALEWIERWVSAKS